MTVLGAALATPALGLTVAGAALGLRGCARRGLRAWAVHVVMALAMLAMLVPAEQAARLGVPSVPWPIVLALALAWTVADAARSRLVATRHLPADDHHGLAAAARGHTREVVDLAATTLLLIGLGTALAPSLGSAGTTSAVAAVPTAHAHGAMATSGGSLAVLVGWAVALLLIASDRRGRDPWGLAGSVVMLAAMAVMAWGHGAG